MPNNSVSTEELHHLFKLNRGILDAEDHNRMLSIEGKWIASIMPLGGVATTPRDSSEFSRFLSEKIGIEADAPPPNASSYVAETCKLEGFAEIIRQFAIDGLTEAQAFFSIIPRLPPEAQMPVMRIFIDEYGCGNIEQMHTELYRRLLQELKLPTDLNEYLGNVNRESYEFVNIFYWLSRRAPTPEYFLGGLAYFESVVPTAFRCYADACARLGIANGKYFTEHIHIDVYHAREAVRAITELGKQRELAWADVVTGACIVSEITARAFEAAVSSAQEKEASYVDA